jgi:hypothetical protein
MFTRDLLLPLLLTTTAITANTATTAATASAVYSSSISPLATGSVRGGIRNDG